MNSLFYNFNILCGKVQESLEVLNMLENRMVVNSEWEFEFTDWDKFYENEAEKADMEDDDIC